MEEQMIQPMLAPECFTSGVLNKLFSIPGKNKVIVISNALLVVLPFCLLIFGADFTSVSVMVKILTAIEVFTKQDLSGPEAKELVQGIIVNVWFLFGMQIFLMALFCILSVVCLVTNGVNFKNIFAKVGSQWRIRRIISWFRPPAFVFITDVIVLILVGLLSASDTSVALILLGLMVVVIATLCCLYFTAVGMFGIVMSVTEINTSELVVLEKSDELIQGRRLQGFALLIFASILSIATFVAFAFKARKGSQGLDAWFAKGIMILCYVCVLKIFMFVLCSVYRYESKMMNGELVDAEGRLGYSLILPTEV